MFLARLIIAVFVLLVILGTLYDLFKIYQSKFKLSQLLSERIVIVDDDKQTIINTDEKENLLKKFDDESRF